VAAIRRQEGQVRESAMRQFGELEAVIMERLWEWGRPALVREVVDDLARDRSIAYTTVMTVMENLHRKGWLRRQRDGRAWRYEPTGSRSGYTAALMSEALATNPDRRTALAHFVLQMSPYDAALLREALDHAQPAGTPAPGTPAPGAPAPGAPPPGPSRPAEGGDR
ncbi:MAG TPA: BlaI/MecI/CopY family transcriptional regulator, partial [Streptosporangiaceae bacterium]|nr:BlaI/MecI/CopY family transcriptional regulator [Streptosporangiaceae bacterium]